MSTGERVSIREGKSPIIFIAPHGADGDDKNTGIIARAAAHAADAYMICNNGWKRAEEHDYYKDLANCNDINHLHEDVVKDEFLMPIIRFKNRIMHKYSTCYVYLIHGLDSSARAYDSSFAMIIGSGAGNVPSYTCKKWMKDLLAYQLSVIGTIYDGKAGGQYAGWKKNNLNQLFRKWAYRDTQVFSMQLEIIRELRGTRVQAELIGELLAQACSDITHYSHWDQPKGWKMAQY